MKYNSYVSSLIKTDLIYDSINPPVKYNINQARSIVFEKGGGGRQQTHPKMLTSIKVNYGVTA